MKTEFDHFNFCLKSSWNLWNIVCRRIKKLCDFWTCPRKIEIKVQSIELLRWKKFRGPELNQGSCLQNSASHLFPVAQNPGTTRFLWSPIVRPPKKSWPKKNPRASFDVLNLCAKFQDHILTGSTLNRGTTKPPRDQICACLL